ncbi:nuclease domain-containing protein [Chloroflexus sp.]|uniref:nuclease domain-containing protein n=1 Tax=Chloroflexus sp. TaxID=1904827 RepID=UPI002ADE8D67|nr:nuclease domain-containing protein [Chloroflexus sp.]
MVDIPLLLLDGVPPSAAIIIEHQIVEWSCSVPVNATAQLTIDGTVLEPFLRPGETVWRWRWQVPAGAGEYEAHLTITSATMHSEWRDLIRVAPSLLDARRYAMLLSDLTRIAPALVHALRGGRQAAGIIGPGHSDPTALLALLTGSATQRFITVLEQYLRRPPKHRLQPDRPQELGAWRERPDPARWWIPVDAHPIPKTNWPNRIRPLRPRSDPAERGLHVAVAVLDRLIVTVQWLLFVDMPSDTRTRLVAISGRLRTLRADIPVPQSSPPVPASWTPRTREERIILAYRRLLRRRLGVGWEPDLLTIPVRDVARLYEVWCAAQVALCLAQHPTWQLNAQSLCEDDHYLRLPTQRPLLSFASSSGTTVQLRYQPRYAPDSRPFCSLDHRVRVPDLALEIIPLQGQPSLILLDAKYRSDSDELPASALDEGYSYLAGIGDGHGQRVVTAIALLFPSTGAPVTYPSGVTLLPLLPGEPLTALRDWLVGWVGKVSV